MNIVATHDFTTPMAQGPYGHGTHVSVGGTDGNNKKLINIRAHKTNSKTEREELLEYIGRLDRQGMSQWEIVAAIPGRFGFTLTQGAVCQNLGIIRQRYRERQLAMREEKVNEQLEALRDVRREAWVAYYRSMEDATKEQVEYGTEMRMVGGGDLESSEEVVKRITTREGRLPSNAYLATVMQTHKAERELLGLDEEVYRNMMRIEEAEQVLRAVLDAQREVLADQPQLLALVQQRCVALAQNIVKQPTRTVVVEVNSEPTSAE